MISRATWQGWGYYLVSCGARRAHHVVIRKRSGHARLGTTYTEAKQKAQILSKQFESVFTNEDVTNVPQLDSSAYPKIGGVLFATRGIQLQLERLDPAKASGPDQLLARVLKLCAEQISPVLQIIFHSH